MSRSVLLLMTSCALMAVIIGCGKRVSYIDLYGIAYNSDRLSHGIPEIPHDWRIQDMGQFFDCINPSQDTTRACHLMKRVFIDASGCIQKEEDQFYSGKSFYYPPEQIQLPQRLALTYDHSPSKTNSPWTIVAQLGPDEFMKDITIQEADRLLQEWGLR